MNNTRIGILRNCINCTLGLMMFAVGIHLVLRANMGAAPWDVFCLGLADTLGILYGNASIIISAAIVIMDIIFGEKIGLGTILDAIVVGKTVDLLNWIDIVPESNNLWLSLAMLIVGFFIEGVSQYFYMKSALSCGPRDSFQVALGRRMPKIPIGVVNIFILATVFIVGYFLGGPIGITSLVAPFGIGLMQELAFRIFKFNPKAVKHQGFFESMKIIFGKADETDGNTDAEASSETHDKIGECMDINTKKLFLLDMDGTLYLGDRLFPETPKFLADIKSRGAKYVFLTNNSSKGMEKYIEKMARFGIETTAEDYLTSVDCIIEHLKDEGDSGLCYVMGTRSFVKQLRDAGIKVVTEVDFATLEDLNAAADGEKTAITEAADGETTGITKVIIGYDTELTYKKLTEVSYLLTTRPEIEYLATNPDWVCPTEFGSVPDCGSMAFMIEKATSRMPEFIGKPEPAMIELAMAKFGATPEETLVIGDRLYTDIKAGNNAGVDTCFVLSGEGTLEDLKTSDAIATVTAKNIGELF